MKIVVALLLFYVHSSSISQHFGNAAHDFIGVVAHIDDGIGSHFPGMLHHQLKGFFAGLFAEFSINGAPSTKKGHKSAGHIAQEAARANGNSSDKT